MKIGNIEIERYEGQLCIRKARHPRRWPGNTFNTLTIEPSELADLRVLLDALEERGDIPPSVRATEIAGVIIEGGHELARNVYAKSMQRCVVHVEVHAETFQYVRQRATMTPGLALKVVDFTSRRVVLAEDVVVVRTESRTGEPLAQLPHNTPQTEDIIYRAVVEGALELRQDIANRTHTIPPLIDVAVSPHLFQRLGGGGRQFFNPCNGVEISVLQDPHDARNGGRRMR